VTIVALRALGVGDFLTAVPALRALARAFPHDHRILAAPAELTPLVRLARCVDEIVDAAPLEDLPAKLADAEMAVNLHGSGPQSHGLLLRLRPRRLIAFAHDAVPQTRESPRWHPFEHEVQRWCRLLRESGIPADANEVDIDLPAHVCAQHDAVVVHPGAASESRRWPAERWIELCIALRRQGYPVLLTGSRSEFRRARTIAKAASLPLSRVLAGRTQLGDLAAIVGGARAVICGDTGIAHLATALHKPSVLLFGPTSPHAWGPPADRSLHRIIWRGTLGDPHAATTDPGLASITVNEVLTELKGAIAA